MAMAAARATLPSTRLTPFSATGPSSECSSRSRVEFAAQLPSGRICDSSTSRSRVWSLLGSCSSRREWRRWRAVAEQLETETEEASEQAVLSDTISVFFEAEGSIPEAAVAKLTSTLEAIEGVSDVDVAAAADGTATVKLTKQMNVQATGVASGLVEVLLEGGFKLQALNLGFDEDNDDDADFYDYDVSASSTEEEQVETAE